MPTAREWWRRAVAAAKDNGSIYLTKIGNGRHLRTGRHGIRLTITPEVEAAVIRATSHGLQSVDYKSAGRIFGWARAAPGAFLQPLMWSVSRRVERTRSWTVALKGLLLAHGLLLCSDEAPPVDRLSRLSFDLSDFRGRSSSDLVYNAFIQAYFRFLDCRSYFGALTELTTPAISSDHDEEIDRLERLQVLLDLLMQIRPYSSGMDVPMVLEAMDCVVIEIFEVYSSICSGIAHFLVGILSPKGKLITPGTEEEENRRWTRGVAGVRILRKATAQNAQLTSYFDLCRCLGVLNAAEFPVVESIPDKDIDELETMLLNGVSAVEEKCKEEKREKKLETVISDEWVIFDDNDYLEKELIYLGTNPFLSLPEPEEKKNPNPFLTLPEKENPFLSLMDKEFLPVEAPAPPFWAAMVNSGANAWSNVNLIDLM